MKSASVQNSRSKPPWLVVRELFDALCGLPPVQRQQQLQLHLAAKGLDATVARELRELLAQHDAVEATNGEFLARPAPLISGWEPGAEPPAVRAGLRLGPWRLVALLGTGGMGQVWEAERDDGAFDARAAIKLLPASHSQARTAQAENLLQREQRALARLAHPHIARLLDAGRSKDGRAYFVMEAVEGQALDQACRALQLAQRLQLCLQLMDAVSHAHAHGLVHCDLKPANVLVTADGQVKLLDFGIAQALRSTAMHSPSQAPMTPAYASPEQARGEKATAASDVYALGVLLHLVLTGQRPYGLTAADTASWLHAVLHEAPSLPSQATNSTHGGLPAVQLRGDLDAIVCKALAKDASQRYASVQALAADLRAVLDSRPVAARPQSWAYVALRFVQRHRIATAALALAALAMTAALGATAWRTQEAVYALALLALGVGLGLSSWQARLAARARDEAQARLAQTNTLVRDVLMRYADLATYLPGGQRMKADLLTDTIAHLERLRATAPADAELAGELAKAHARLADMQLPGLDTTLDQPDEARAHASAALALFPVGEPAHRLDPAYAMWWARAWRVQLKMQRLAGDAKAALAGAERMRRFLQAAVQRHAGNADLRAEYGSVLFNIGQTCDTWVEPSLNLAPRALAALAEAETVYAELARERPQDGDARFQLGTVAGAQSIVLRRQGRLNEAVDAGRRAVGWRESALSLQPGHTSYREGVAGEANNFAMLLLELGTPQAVQEATDVTQRGDVLMAALQTEDPGFATWPVRRRWFALHRGRALLALGRAAEALPVLQEALLAMAAPQAVTLRRRALCELSIAQALQMLGRSVEAQTSARDAVTHLQAFRAQTPDDPEAEQILATASALANCAVAAD